MKDMLVPIDKAGRVVLPKSLREELAIQPGDMLKVSLHGNEVTLCPEKRTAGFVRTGRALVFSSGGAGLLNRETVEATLAEQLEKGATAMVRRLPGPKRK